MTVIICLDDNNGMAFNKRRQSRDSKVMENIRELFGEPIHIAPYSEKIFQIAGLEYTVCADLASQRDGVLFVETFDPALLADCTDRLVIYRWNRLYPADLRCTLDLSGFHRGESVEFVGSSHEKITREIFEKIK